MLDELDTETQFLGALAAATRLDLPYRHWLLREVLPASLLEAIIRLPVPAPTLGDTQGRRETHNATRWFFGTNAQRETPACAALALALQGRAAVAALEAHCAVQLSGSYLRIEYCQDSAGFWLEPHTDIGAKLFTMLVYLSDSAPGEEWGTDIYSSGATYFGTVPFRRNHGLIFIPSQESWHGFAKRPMTGVRRSLIVNYVVPDWRARHELAFPDSPVP